MREASFLLLLLLLACACKKPDTEPAATETGIRPPLRIQLDSGYAAFANAFTPNGDGRNDVFRMVRSGPLTGPFRITVMDGRAQVFSSTDPDFAWGPASYSGLPKTFVVRVETSPATAQTGSLTIPYTDPATYCVKDTAGLRFEDQIELSTGEAIYPTGESLCP